MPNECNIPSRTIFTGDNLDILRGVNSDCVDLIYLDPPFNSNQTYAAPLDSEAKGAEFDDVWTLDDMKEEWIDEIELRMPSLFHLINGAKLAHGESMAGYLTFMSVRLIELHRVLKPTGSIYLHCDDTAVHYLDLAIAGNELALYVLCVSARPWCCPMPAQAGYIVTLPRLPRFAAADRCAR